MGRPSKPTELKVLEGNKGKRALNKGEPQPDFLNDLLPPAWLPEEAAAVWRELAFRLRGAKVLTVLDVPALEKMCVSIATYRRATRFAIGNELVELAKKAEEAKPEKGEKSEKSSAEKTPAPAAPGSNALGLNPWLIVQSMAYKQATALMREFGMTPAARSRVLIDPQLGLFGDGNEKKESYFT